jgi:tRNA isopentenyl-2-thiomethyl-A-37 hydroxylase MiaE
MIYSVKNFENEIRHRRKDLNEYYQNILKTEITVRQYQNAYSLISQLKNQKQMRKFRQYMTELLSEPAQN